MAKDSAGADLRRQPGPHAFVDDLEAPTLEEADRHHLARALRLRSGDPLTVSDGRGRWRTARFGDRLVPESPIVAVPPPSHTVGLGVALTKAGKPDLVVQKATELGVERIVLFHAEYSVARWDAARQAKGIARLARVAREAAMQSRQVWVPTVAFADDLAALAALVGPRGMARADFGGAAIGGPPHFVAIGPEGGWSDGERAAITATVDLGPSVLRAETASRLLPPGDENLQFIDIPENESRSWSSLRIDERMNSRPLSRNH